MQGGFKTYCVALKFPTLPYTSIDAIQGTQEGDKLSMQLNCFVISLAFYARCDWSI